MKGLLGALLASLCLLAPLVAAADPPPNPTVTLADDGTVSFAGFSAPCAQQSRALSACTQESCSAVKGQDLNGSIGIEELGPKSPRSAASALRRDLLLGVPIFCDSSPAPARITIRSTPPKAQNWHLSTALPASTTAQSTSLTWNGWNDAVFNPLLSALAANGVKLACFYSDGNHQAMANQECRVAITRGPSGGGVFTFIPNAPASAREVVVTATEGGKTGTFSIPIEDCAFTSVPPYDTLFAGADSQLLFVRASQGCQARLERESTVSLQAADKHEIRARVRSFEQHPDVVALELSAVPADAGARWDLVSSAGSGIGSLVLRDPEAPLSMVLDADNKPVLEVHYQSEYFDSRQVPRSVGGFAVVTQAEQDEREDFLYIRNVPQLSVAAGVRALEATIKSRRNTDADRCNRPDKKSSEHVCEYASLAWSAHADSWRDALWFHTGRSRDFERMWEQGAARVDNLTDLEFAVLAASQEPLAITLALDDPQLRTGSSAPPVTVLSFKTIMASGARRESLALPISEALFVSCGDIGALEVEPELVGFGGVREGLDVVLHGTTRAINEDDLATGQCRVHYSPTRAAQLSGDGDARHNRRRLIHYGAQELEIVIRRGEAEQKVPWQVDPSEGSYRALPKPESKDNTGFYSVSVRQLSPQGPPVRYRGSTASDPQRPAATLSDLEFRANLRPRGHLAWVSLPIRTFLTLPVEAVGMRFPSNPRELEASSDNPNAQIVTGRIGAAIAIEPWDYDRGANPWPIPTRLLTGLMFFQVSEGNFSPTWITGAQLTFPLLELPPGHTADQLGVDGAVGMFWEHDLEEGGGDHFLLTLGVDVLSLFGAK